MDFDISQFLYGLPGGSILGNPKEAGLQDAFSKAQASLEQLKGQQQVQNEAALKRGYEFNRPQHQMMQMLFPGMFPSFEQYYGNLPGDPGYAGGKLEAAAAPKAPQIPGGPMGTVVNGLMGDGKPSTGSGGGAGAPLGILKGLF